MYAGHVGIALGAKGLRVPIPLWVLVVAAQLPDWADAGFCVVGIRSAVPGMYTHSFAAIAVLSALAAALYFGASRDAVSGAIVGAVVVTHVLGDYITGIKPTWAGGPLAGFGIYDNPPLDFLVEAIAILVGWLLYRQTIAKPRRNTLPVNLILVALLLFQLAAVIAFSISPPLRKC